MSKRRGMLLVVHAVLGRVMVSGPMNVKLVASKTAASMTMLTASGIEGAGSRINLSATFPPLPWGKLQLYDPAGSSMSTKTLLTLLLKLGPMCSTWSLAHRLVAFLLPSCDDVSTTVAVGVIARRSDGDEAIGWTTELSSSSMY